LTAAVLAAVLSVACGGTITGGFPPTATAPPASATETATTPEATASPNAVPTSTPRPASTPAPTPAVLIAAGDISRCGDDSDEATAKLVESRPGVVAALGDTAYDIGSAANFAECYDPTWGRFKDRTRPAVGNHEYLTPGAAGYFDYFGDAAGERGKGYYSFDLGAWHIVVLNSLCWEVGGCGLEAPQAEWLTADLREHPAVCTLAYWHFPRFSSGLHGSSDVVQRYWEILHGAGAEIVLVGHDHTYERFTPLDDRGQPDPERGLRQFVVGTGGGSLYGFPTILPGSEVREARTFGVLVLTLYEDRYEWEFVPVAGASFTDRGEGVCHP
jgi:hypothetical protein